MTVDLIDHQPGNGTRYVVCLEPASEGRWLFAWVNAGGGGRCMILSSGLVHYTYMAEKLGLSNEADLAGLLGFLRSEGLSVAMPPGYDEDGLRLHPFGRTLSFVFHTDPGHGWLEVPRSLVIATNIKVSEVSHQRGSSVFLEEDMDAGAMLAALEKAGCVVHVTEKHDEESPIRNYANYEPCS